jgi:hypothetical protein
LYHEAEATEAMETKQQVSKDPCGGGIRLVFLLLLHLLRSLAPLCDLGSSAEL